MTANLNARNLVAEAKQLRSDLMLDSIGRNAPCPCGSGKKYKKCHGANGGADLNFPRNNYPSSKAMELQRIKQQGLGRPIISEVKNNQRVVRVGDKVHSSSKWKTFNDFLFDYIKLVLGHEWGNNEIKKPFNERHPILQWYDMICKLQKKHITVPGEIHKVPSTGANVAYLQLAYNLYLLQHNEKVQECLISRLKNIDQFSGAYYETFVAAAFIKAGFDLQFENEDDPTQSHCEFTAIHKKTLNKYSVEAKSRYPGKANADIGQQIKKALKKTAYHPRIVFIDVNVADESSDETVVYHNEVYGCLRRMEKSLKFGGHPAPPAYVFITNHPYQYGLESTGHRFSFISDSFKIPEFAVTHKFSSVREAVNSEKIHSPIIQLAESMRDHYNPPSTFDGEIPELAYHKSTPRLIIGQKYLIPYEGLQIPGELTDAIVVDKKKCVYGIYKLENGRSVIATCPITEDELTAYHKYPDTFFGAYKRPTTSAKSPIELFRFIHESYEYTPKSKLLSFMKDAPDYDKLKSMNQGELVFTYAERVTYGIMADQQSKTK